MNTEYYIIIDNNLSHKLRYTVFSQYSEVYHVKELDFEAKEDSVIWTFAALKRGVILTKDADFYHMSNLYGSPPKVIWIRMGNATTQSIAQLLKSKSSEISNFLKNPNSGLLELY
jgi:predicted nuclease of predicted toxin-antitoxin system